MPTAAEKFADLLVDHAVDVDELAEEHLQPQADRQVELLHFPEERDPQLWADGAEAAELDAETVLAVTWDDLTEVPIPQRNREWRDTMSLLLAASQIQAAFDVGLIEDGINLAERHATEENAKRPGAVVLRETAKIGVTKTAIDAKAAERKAARAALAQEAAKVEGDAVADAEPVEG